MSGRNGATATENAYLAGRARLILRLILYPYGGVLTRLQQKCQTQEDVASSVFIWLLAAPGCVSLVAPLRPGCERP
jgi:hypothetical protein